ncbi:MAG: hypothetical protein KF684_07470 [Phycisphaeraceae bacterium]|nr:hypothetical protein [Phycisphaeraceae bacterium]
MNTQNTIVAAGLALALGASAGAAITITRGTSAPTYASTLTFDEPGGATGTDLPSSSFQSSGIASLYSGSGSNFVGPLGNNPGFGWLGSSNVFYGPFGVFIEIGQDVDAFSFQFWDSSGNPTFMGGGARVIVLNDGVEVASTIAFRPAFGGTGDSWFNIEATDGMVFDEVRALGFGFFPESLVDNLSWRVIPTPGACAVLAFAGVATLRRRRA